MYSLEELKALLFLIGAAILGRILFYRALCLEGNFKQRVKIRLLQWLWEIPVIVTVALLSFESVTYFKLRPSTGIVFAIFIGYVGIGTLKIWLEDWMESQTRKKDYHRRKTDDD